MESIYKQTDVSKQIVDLATKLIHRGGSKSFSYRDLAKEIGIKSSSIHYYFPAKEDLVIAVIKSYLTESEKDREYISSSSNDPKAKLQMYLDSYIKSYKNNSCIGFCTMIASDSANLPDIVNVEATKLFSSNISWITAVIEQGLGKKVFTTVQPPGEIAQTIFSLMEGSAVTSKILGDDRPLHSTSEHIMQTLEAKDKGIISKYLSIGR